MPYRRIAIVFARASGCPPPPLVRLAKACLNEARWQREPSLSWEPDITALIITAVPRANMASKRPMGNTTKLQGTKLAEMIGVLDAATNGMRVDLLSVGINGLTTDVDSFVWLQEKCGSRLQIRVVVAVPSTFPGTKITFPAAANGIRYGAFALQDLAEAAATNDDSLVGTPAGELIKIFRQIRADKVGRAGALLFICCDMPLSLIISREEVYQNLSGWIFGRTTITVCPDSISGTAS